MGFSILIYRSENRFIIRIFSMENANAIMNKYMLCTSLNAPINLLSYGISASRALHNKYFQNAMSKYVCLTIRCNWLYSKKKLLLHSLLQVEYCMHLHALSFQSNVYLNINEKYVSKREIKCKWTKIHFQQQFDICISCSVRFKYSILFNLLRRFAFIAMTISIHFTCVS